MEDNLKLWNTVEKTNPKYTKKAKVGGMNITAIAPQYQIMMVTEQFGVYGKTWGFKNIELDYSLIDKYDMVVFKGTFFFPEGQFQIINSYKLFINNAKTMLDDNFAKKIETDTLTKAISKLGFNADIFLGKFDDVRYVDSIKNDFKTDAEKAEELKEIEDAKKAAEDSKPAIKDSQFKSVIESKNKAHAKHFVENFRMSDDERTQLKKLL
jgi:hypothetical protein